MKPVEREIVTQIFIAICVLIVVLIPVCAWKWYRAGVQQEVWNREGIHMTRWEVFTGATPASRQFINQDKP